MMRLLIPLIFIVFMPEALLSKEIDFHRNSHPLNPNDSANSDAAYSEPILEPKSGVSELEKQKKELEDILASFPPHESLTYPPRQKFGYMSKQLDLTGERKPINQWVELVFFGAKPLELESITLIPSFYPKIVSDSSFAFPKRFKIEIFPDTNSRERVTVVDWTEQDFPDPGLYPVIFRLPHVMRAKKVRLTVTRGSIHGNKEFFALDEMMAFRPGSNGASPLITKVNVSSTTALKPYWASPFLNNRRTHLGAYLHTKRPTIDFTNRFKNQVRQHKPITITIDLGESQSLGNIEFLSAQNAKPAAPNYPLPEKIRIEVYESLQSKKPVRKVLLTGHPEAPFLRKVLHSADGRFVKIFIDSLYDYHGEYVFAIGEIRILGDQVENNYNVAAGKKVTIRNHPRKHFPNPALLVDGYTGGQKIIVENIYLEQLAKRQLVEKALHHVSQKLTIARAIRTQQYWTVTITAALSIIFISVLLFFRQKHQKRKAVYQVQQQIADDLHDDISGNLGTISMISGNLTHMKNPELLDKKVLEINHLAHESFMSLKEIIWHTSEDTIRFSELFDQIERTATSILTNTKVNCQFPTTFEELIVPVNTRRNIILLTKETLYNCAKYAEASNVAISAHVTEAHLELMIQDDGRGFDPSDKIVKTKQGGRGLENMKKRAKMLGAKLSIDSATGKGTTTTLKMPIKSKTK